MPRYFTTAIVMAAALGASACSKKTPAELPPPPGAAEGQGAFGDRDTSIAPGSQADFLQQMSGQEIIYFDTDRFNIDSLDADALRTQAEWLAQYPSKRATIEGHADERGTREYNVALGERRANAAKNFLQSLGVDASRLSTVSYGKERPVALGSTEEAWALNRRAVTITID